MEHITLNNVGQMPLLGFSVYQIPDPQDYEASILATLRTGYRLIDTAAAYGHEEALGRTIAKGGVPREELFITTKLWVQGAGYEPTKAAFPPDRMMAFLMHHEVKPAVNQIETHSFHQQIETQQFLGAAAGGAWL